MLDPLAVCQQFMRLFEQRHQHTLQHCGELFADDFVFRCSGPSSNPLAREVIGLDGFQGWLDQFFGYFTRQPSHQLSPTYLHRESTILVRYHEVVMAGELTSPPIWVNLHFDVRDCKIVRIIDEYDTQTGEEFLRAVFSSTKKR